MKKTRKMGRKKFCDDKWWNEVNFGQTIKWYLKANIREQNWMSFSIHKYTAHPLIFHFTVYCLSPNTENFEQRYEWFLFSPTSSIENVNGIQELSTNNSSIPLHWDLIWLLMFHSNTINLFYYPSRTDSVSKWIIFRRAFNTL